MYDHVTDQAVKTVESHPNIQLEFTFYHLPRQYVTVDGLGMLPHLVEGVGMALPLSRPQFLQASFPCQTGCGEYISRWSQPLIKGKCLHYPLGSVSTSALASGRRGRAALQEASEDICSWREENRWDVCARVRRQLHLKSVDRLGLEATPPWTANLQLFLEALNVQEEQYIYFSFLLFF